MQLYTKVLIGMLVGIIAGFVVGPNAPLMPKDGSCPRSVMRHPACDDGRTYKGILSYFGIGGACRIANL